MIKISETYKNTNPMEPYAGPTGANSEVDHTQWLSSHDVVKNPETANKQAELSVLVGSIALRDIVSYVSESPKPRHRAPQPGEVDYR